MATNNYSRKRYRIKYKNVAILLAILLLIILLIGKGCSALFSHKEKKSENPVVSGDNVEDPAMPDENGLVLTTDPTLQTSYYFTSVQRTDADLGVGNLVLVNNNIEFKGTVTEDDLDVVREKKNGAYAVKDYTVMVQPEAMEALNTMLLDFYNLTGKDGVMVNAGYRTIEYQQELYQDDLDKTGSETSSLVAKPGYSEHHTGLAVDFTVYENGKYDQSKIAEGDYLWIYENSYKYGFVNRYPKGKESITMIDNEPWHFRYVGVAHSTAMKNYDYCLEEYIEFLKNYTISTGFLSVTADDGAQYIIYYVPRSETGTTDVWLPEKDHATKELYPYEISGNNVDGFVVTFLYKEGTGITAPVQDGAPENADAEPDSAEPEDGGDAEEA